MQHSPNLAGVALERVLDQSFRPMELRMDPLIHMLLLVGHRTKEPLLALIQHAQSPVYLPVKHKRLKDSH